MTRLNYYLKTAETVRVLGGSPDTLRLWAAGGKVADRRNPANGYRLFQRQDLDTFLRAVETPAGGAKAK
jgi:DNA-binding transcriptional MerR regulator